jgi:hypothetical protein
MVTPPNGVRPRQALVDADRTTLKLLNGNP